MRYRVRFGCAVAVLAAAAAITACGGSSKKETTAAEATAQETTAEETTESETKKEKETTEAETETNASGGVVVKPLQDDNAVSSNMPDGAYYVQLDPESLKKDGDHYTVSAEFFSFDRYDPAEVNELKEGDSIKVLGENVDIKSIERSSRDADGNATSTEKGELSFDYVEINGGIENNGVNLLLDGEYYRTQSLDDYPLYYSLGEAVIPLSKDVQYMDFSDLQSKSGQVYTSDQLEEVFKNEKDKIWGPQAISIVIKNGEVTKIFRTYTP